MAVTSSRSLEWNRDVRAGLVVVAGPERGVGDITAAGEPLEFSSSTGKEMPGWIPLLLLLQ